MAEVLRDNRQVLAGAILLRHEGCHHIRMRYLLCNGHFESRPSRNVIVCPDRDVLLMGALGSD
eukprot:3101530-Pyramimonas_sp.AAC.1